ncbi:Clathrin coat assembly protein AP180 [Striga hermonthica]|uniref:Clathrin coat assembly protein AP180 n=1 Tax=Striga hermonthica TaxID=68872 RepID=A0A9N7NUJ2_STRHE|nr:Clathrin coat assembly protein AP180 [Striga hermonthica]
MPSKFLKALGAVKDSASIGLAKVSGTPYTSLEVAILRATTHNEDSLPIDHGSIDDVLRLVSSNKFYAAACARVVARRISRTRNWVVALKSLVLVLRVFQDGDPYFPREVLLATRCGARILNLSSFRDASNSLSPWDFTAFVRTYALYLDERLECFLTGKLQRRSSPTRGRRTEGPTPAARDMKPAALLDQIACWQRLLDRAVGTRPTGPARSNRLVQAALYVVVRESFDLYRDVSDGLKLVLDNFFHLQFQNCVGAFQACTRAVRQFRELSEFYTVCKSIGVGRSSEYPSVETISEELVDALQEFLKDQSSFPLRSSGPSRDNPIGKGLPENNVGPEASPQCTTSLEDLINASDTRTCPAISIDLEAYAGPRQDDTFEPMSETGSTHSLPISNSMADLMSLWEWSEQEESDKQHKQQEKEQKQQNHSKNWELVLTETLSSSVEVTAKNNNSATGWEVVLFEATRSAQQYTQQPKPNVMIMPPNNHYNPFLQDTIEVSNFQQATTLPTFQAIPPFPMHNHQMSCGAQLASNDPFAVPYSFSSEPMYSDSHVDQQSVLYEQQLWLRNQNKIIAKHMT